MVGTPRVRAAPAAGSRLPAGGVGSLGTCWGQEIAVKPMPVPCCCSRRQHLPYRAAQLPILRRRRPLVLAACGIRFRGGGNGRWWSDGRRAHRPTAQPQQLALVRAPAGMPVANPVFARYRTLWGVAEAFSSPPPLGNFIALARHPPGENSRCSARWSVSGPGSTTPVTAVPAPSSCQRPDMPRASGSLQ